ncbi:DUF4190 domain-containing protein [Rathayibacter tritici]|uniref:Uncharacterized protein n=1 Tax=Rathayibacter tritici TaxID=33888 RepID=A0A160KPU3_9MICO|nr:DUF4190 domain-containing protein [Rathayibacter tritici]AND15313.1 hypothetical protein A6122_0147 [Rathayibacter tritici]PPF27987.1 DUF4190 domain-containing protein [Rathayibacter tritici]PPF65240.1 DUF4190 domain-containing protein [Rathayibacter tritici]PPG04846.1 DUF4190 domain-containing protein [Rathayibacter tritici]PPI19004.1 DUF4190 domain-containing protein [Rathayibacter tritici]
MPARSALAITALILGIAAVPLAFVPVLGAPAGITAVIMGIVCLAKKRPPKGFAVSGIVLGALGVVLAVVVVVVTVFGVLSAVGKQQAVSRPGTAQEEQMTSTFNDGVVFDDGIAIGASSPAPYQPGKYATGADQAQNVVLTFVLKNNSDKPYEPYVVIDASSGGVEASRISDYDSGETFNDPTTAVLPGGSVTWKRAFSVADPAALIVQVHVDQHSTVIFTDVH